MATSGSVDFSLTRNELIKGAYRLIGIGTEGETLSNYEIASGAEALNLMTKAWQAQGIHLWQYGEATLFLEVGKQSYDIGPTGDHCTLSYVETALSADEASASTSIDVDSDSGISDGDNIGIVLDDGSIHWDTVNGAPAGNVVTITNGLSGAASEDNVVYAYTSKINRPLKIHNVRLEQDDGDETEMLQWARSDYMIQPSKATQGTPTQWFFSPQLTNGKLYLWPTTNTVDHVVNFTAELPIEDFDAASNDPDFPVEWLEAIKWNLAVRLAVEYGVPQQRIALVEAKAKQFLDDALAWDREDASIQFAPDFTY